MIWELGKQRGIKYCQNGFKMLYPVGYSLGDQLGNIHKIGLVSETCLQLNPIKSKNEICRLCEVCDN